MNLVKPKAPSAERNKEAILTALRQEIASAKLVLEYGSGTGQHICHFAKALPNITWQPSDLADKLPGMQLWIEEAACDNILPPIELDLTKSIKPNLDADICYSANTLHIVSWKSVQELFKHASDTLSTQGKLCIYGPYRFDGKHISDGNIRFDQQLREGNPDSGIRDLTDLNKLAKEHLDRLVLLSILRLDEFRLGLVAIRFLFTSVAFKIRSRNRSQASTLFRSRLRRP